MVLVHQIYENEVKILSLKKEKFRHVLNENLVNLDYKKNSKNRREYEEFYER